MTMLLAGVVACLGVAQAVNIVFEPLPAGAPKGDDYRRLEDPHIPVYVHGHSFAKSKDAAAQGQRELQGCNANQQVHLILGGAGTGSVTVSYVGSLSNPTFNGAAGTVLYGTSPTSLTSSVAATPNAYSQLLAPGAGNLIVPGMGKPQANITQVLGIVDASMAYDMYGAANIDPKYQTSNFPTPLGPMTVGKWKSYLLAGVTNTLTYTLQQSPGIAGGSNFVSGNNDLSIPLAGKTYYTINSASSDAGYPNSFGATFGSNAAATMDYYWQGAYYDSPLIYTAVISGLTGGATYYYKPSDNCATFSFTMPPAPGAASYPFVLGTIADTGTTAVSSLTLAAVKQFKPNLALLVGDLSYADGWTPIWDAWGNMLEGLGSSVPMLFAQGNHELMFTENSQSYNARYPAPYQDSNSPSPCYYGKATGPIHVITLCSYVATRFAGLMKNQMTLQYQWLSWYLANRVNRVQTPWLIVQFHSPMYCSNAGHWKEAELFRYEYEPLFYQYGVDIVFNGHVHAYERSNPVYNNATNPCGTVHIVIGDGGNYENAYVPWRNDPYYTVGPKGMSAFRESSFGAGALTVQSATQANFTWHRVACGAKTLFTGASWPTVTTNALNTNNLGGNGYQVADWTLGNAACSSTDSKGTADNSAQRFFAVDSAIITRPSQAQCPNKYLGTAPAQSRKLRFEPTPQVPPRADPAPAAAAVQEDRKLTTIPVVEPKIEIKPLPAGAPKGDNYRRIEEKMPMYEHPMQTPYARKLAGCNANQQVHLIMGGAGTGSVTVTWVGSTASPSFGSGYATLMYGTTTSMSSSVIVSGTTYSQLLAPTQGNLVAPSMGKPGANISTIVGVADTSSFAFDIPGNIGGVSQVPNPNGGGLMSVAKWGSYLLAGVTNTLSFTQKQTSGVQTGPFSTVTTTNVTKLNQNYYTINYGAQAANQIGAGGGAQMSYYAQNAYYDAPLIYSTVLTGLTGGTTYYYKPSDNCATFSFTMPPAPGAGSYPFVLGTIADTGTTVVSGLVMAAVKQFKPQAAILVGDLSYADGWTPVWDVFGNMLEGLGSSVPMLFAQGNHELGSTEQSQSYYARYPAPYAEANSPSPCYYGKATGPIHVITLCSYTATRFTGLMKGKMTLQYQWLSWYLANRVNRAQTPWLIVQFHVPMYCSNVGHWKEGELFRYEYESLFYQYGVDIVFNGHVHAYERSNPIYNNATNPCGTVHIVIGDGGNYENAYVPWRNDPYYTVGPKGMSAFRESSFGAGALTVQSATQANFTWHRVACGAATIFTGDKWPTATTNALNVNNLGGNGYQVADWTLGNAACSSTDSKGTPDNSAQRFFAVDSAVITRPSQAQCPNKYAGSAPAATTPTPIAYSEVITGVTLAVAQSAAFTQAFIWATAQTVGVPQSSISVTFTQATSRRGLLAPGDILGSGSINPGQGTNTNQLLNKLAGAGAGIGGLLRGAGFSGAGVQNPLVFSPTSAPAAVPVTVPASSPTAASSCFAADELLMLESGATKAISEVMVGDRVLTVNAKGEQVYSDVAYLPHGQNTEKAVFTVLATEAGRDVKMTANHVLPAGACDLASPMPYVAASAVAAGDCVETVSGRERVVSVSTVEGKGIYTVIAMEELLVVNGVVATPYGGINPMLANVYYNLHRLAYQVFGAGAMKPWVQAATEMLWGSMSV